MTERSSACHSLAVTVSADLGQHEQLMVEVRDESAAPAPAWTFEDIYEQYFDLVWRTLRRLGVAEAAVDDALQDVFLVVHRRLPDFEQRSTTKTWVFGITLRIASDYTRRRRHQLQASDRDLESCQYSGPDPLEQRERREAVELLYGVLDELDPDKRAVFVLAELEELSMVEIAVVVGANVNTVSSRVKAARSKFEAALRRVRAKDAWRSRP